MIIGAGKFAVEVTRYIDDINARHPEFAISGYVPVDGDPTVVDGDRPVTTADHVPVPGTWVVVAVSDPQLRRSLIDDYVVPHELRPANIVHPEARLDPAALRGAGNIIGPWCYVGADSTIHSFNVIHYHCSIGHHSRIGSNNFIAPNFHCGNSVDIGDDNFFGLSCTVAPGVTVGDSSTFQAGIALFEQPESGRSYFAPNRLKSIGSLKEIK